MKTLTILLFLLPFLSHGQYEHDELLPTRGLCIASPKADQVNRFAKFIKEELGPNHINTLILRVDYNYQYRSHPELADEGALSKQQVKKLVAACDSNDIQLIPQINLLGHQSWHSSLTGLLRVYPNFDETPHIELPEKYEWPNEDGLYCKSYCPLHPDVHKVVFELVDEIMEVFNAKAFHAGMDEVFYIGDDRCPRCAGRSKAELFAGEVTKIRNHLALQNRSLWIWGDRLIDGKTTGIGMWEASMNNTHQAIDLIPKDVFICDWHYERADPTAAMFALKGFNVATCVWRNGELAKKQLEMMVSFRKNATAATKSHYQGMIQTVWTSAENFMDYYYRIKEQPNPDKGDQAGCFKDLLKAMSELPESEK
jgi:hypothetical protein